MDSSDGSFSEDLMLEILSRFPVKSLMRFKCVCKSLYVLVRSPNFILKHLTNHDDDNTRLFISYMDAVCHEPRYTLYSDETLNDLTYQELDSQVPVFGQIMGPYNGLFCFHGYTNRITLWNPATRESKTLPKFETRPPQHTNVCFCNVGFEPNVSSGDYKLAIVRNLWDDELRSFYVFPHVSLYNPSTNYWRDIEVLKLKDYSFLQYLSPDTYLNGVCYWLGIRQGNNILLSFNMDDEVLEELTRPSIPYLGSAAFGLHKESLLLLLFDRDENFFEIWILKEMCWSKKMTISPILGVREPLGFWKNNAFFMESSNEKLLIYDPDSSELRDLELGAHGIEVHKYKESLITVKSDCSFIDFFDIPWHVLGVGEIDEQMS